MKNVLAFFGAFNPPTLAHLELARFAMEATGREGVVFVPSQARYIQNEQGKDYAYGDAQRLAMLRAAAEKRPWMQVEPLELEAPCQPRTYDTLRALKEKGYAPALLLGSDKLPELERGWLHVEEIAREFGIVCLSRGEEDAGKLIAEDAYLRALSPFIRVLKTPPDFRQVSSSAVRRRQAQVRAMQEEIRQMVPEEVFRLL